MILEPFGLSTRPYTKVFTDYTCNNAILYVPYGTVESYKSTNGWKEFKNIEEIASTFIKLNVADKDNNDITDKVIIKWYNSVGKQIGTGGILYAIIEEGTELFFSILLDEDLGRIYREVKMKKIVASSEPILCQLEDIGNVNLHGKVTTFGMPLSNADIRLSQWLNGKYEYTTNTTTDANGEFTLAAYNDSTELTAASHGFLDGKIVRSAIENDGEIGTIDLQPVTGKVIALTLSYQPSVKDGEEPTVQDWYSDTRNIEYGIRNITKGKDIDDFALQQGNIILPDGTDVGDRLQVSLHSLNGKFADVVAEGEVSANDTVRVTVRLVELGGVEVVFKLKGDDQLIAMIYDSDGKLVSSATTAKSMVTFRALPAGNYTLVAMGYNGTVGGFGDISAIDDFGLVEGSDYVTAHITVRNGIVSSTAIDEVPEVDASKFEYLSENASYLPNKTEMTVNGSYVTLTARVDFKPQYADMVDDVKVVIDIPDGCEFIANTVVAGTKALPHTVDGRRLTIALGKEDIDSRIRFCMIPKQPGIFSSTANALFDCRGKQQQTIGISVFEAMAGTIAVPASTGSKTVTVSGISAPHAKVGIYDNSHFVGTTTALGDGKWNTSVELYKAYNLSVHELYAKYETGIGINVTTDAKMCIYDKSSVEAKSVTMINTAHLATLTPEQITTIFDLEALTTSGNSYRYWPKYPDFTFIADLTANDTVLVKGVTFYIYTTSKRIRTLKGFFDEKLGRWVAVGKFETNSLPVNVSVETDADTEATADDVLMAETVNALETMQTELKDSEEQAGQILSQMAEGDAAAIERLMAQLSALLNIGLGGTGVQGVPSDEEWQALRDEADAHIAGYSGTLKGFENVELRNLNADIAALMEGISVKSASGLDAATLISEGYEEIGKTDDSKLYVKCGESGLAIVDFHLDIYITIATSNMTWTPSEENVQKAIDEIKSRIDGLVSTATRILSEIESLSDTNGQMCSVIAGLYVAAHDDASLRQACFERLQVLVKIHVRLVLLRRWLSQLRGGLFVKASWSLYDLLTSLTGGLQYVQTLDKLYKSIPDCEQTAQEAAELKQQIDTFRNEALAYYCGGAGAYMVSFVATAKGLSQTLEAKGALFPVVSATLSLVFTKSAIDVAYVAKCSNFVRYVNDQIARLGSKCGYDEETDGDAPLPVTPNVTPIHDPSGFVYEAVPTNRMEGVTASIYCDEDGPQLWDAADFSQVNPQVTDETGLYQWDVPQGQWQVRFEKSGYETTQTEWLPVPPPQLEINIPMSQTVAPRVINARGTESGVKLEFSKYMKPETVEKSGRVSATVNGKSASGDVEMLNLEEDPYTGKEYASKVKFVPTTAFKTTDEVVITVKKEVESYADKQMDEDFVATVKIEPEIDGLQCDSLIAVDYQGDYVLEIAATPAAAVRGKKLGITTTSAMIATIVEGADATLGGDAVDATLGGVAHYVTFDDEGKAQVTVSGYLPGCASLHLQIDGTDIEKYVEVNVVLHETVVKAPKASKRSGSTIEAGYLLWLTSSTPGANIYYTLDGSCPCDEATRLKYTGPFVLPAGKVTVKAIASRQGMEDSEVASFTYTVEGTVGIAGSKKDLCFDVTYSDGTLTISGADGCTVHVYDLLGRELASKRNVKGTVSLNVPQTESYIVSATTRDGHTVVRKVMKN